MDEKTRKHMVQQIRKCIAIKGKEQPWIGALDDGKLFQLFVKVKNHETSQGIAKHIMENWKLREGSSLHATAQAVGKFRKRVASLLLAPMQPENSEPHNNSFANTDIHSSLESLANLAANLERRIQAMLKEEQETGLRNPTLSKEILSLVALKKAILREKAWHSRMVTRPILLERQRQADERLRQGFIGSWKICPMRAKESSPVLGGLSMPLKKRL